MPLLLQTDRQTVAPLMSIPESRRLSNETDRSDNANTKRDWCPAGNSVCRLLHREDIGSRSVEIVTARLRKLKKRSGVRDRARKKKAGDADRIWLTSCMAAIKKASRGNCMSSPRQQKLIRDLSQCALRGRGVH